MAGWKKYFKVADTSGVMSPISGGASRGSSGEFGFRNYQSHLPEVYSGHPNRIERYNQYENMDCDSEVNACLDIISEFSTQNSDSTQTPFDIDFYENPTDREVEIVKKQLQQWVKLNELDKRIFKLFRNVLKYGDQVFVRDPETFEMYWVDMTKVKRVIVNENEGKRPEQYVIQDINPNFQNLTVAAKTTTDFQVNPPAGGQASNFNYTAPSAQGMGGESRFTHTINETVIDAEHVVHLSLNEGLDYYWPFGQSILEMIFKVFKQKELLEDAILIYRVQRAPERRVFYIDVGNMPSHLAMQFVERVKNEVHQRRIPTQTGGSANALDATYNPLSINEDYFFPTTAEGRGSKVETLPGGENLGQIDDLKYFNNKLARGLRVPSSYLPTGPDESSQPLNDGRVGTALIQEYRFNQYCERLQRQIMQKLDDEFKMFLRWRGFNIDSGIFGIKFTAPQNFASYRQAELDTTRMQAFTSLEQLPYMSKRFLLQRYLGLTDAEIQENSKLWAEERDEPEMEGSGGQELRSVGISPADIEGDIDVGTNLDIPGEEGAVDLGAEAGVEPTPETPPAV